MYDNLWGCYILFQQKYNKKISQRIHLYSIRPILPSKCMSLFYHTLL